MKYITTAISVLTLVLTITNARAIVVIEGGIPPFCHGQFETCRTRCVGVHCVRECNDYLNACIANPGFVIWEPGWWERWHHHWHGPWRHHHDWREHHHREHHHGEVHHHHR